MASEVQFQASLNAMKSGARVGYSAAQVIDMTGYNMLQQTQDIGTVAEQVTFGDIAGAPRKVLLVNLDATNYVEVDSAEAMDKFPQKLLAGDSILLSPQTATIYAKAHTAAVRLFKIAVEA